MGYYDGYYNRASVVKKKKKRVERGLRKDGFSRKTRVTTAALKRPELTRVFGGVAEYVRVETGEWQPDTYFAMVTVGLYNNVGSDGVLDRKSKTRNSGDRHVRDETVRVELKGVSKGKHRASITDALRMGGIELPVKTSIDFPAVETDAARKERLRPTYDSPRRDSQAYRW